MHSQTLGSYGLQQTSINSVDQWISTRNWTPGPRERTWHSEDARRDSDHDWFPGARFLGTVGPIIVPHSGWRQFMAWLSTTSFLKGDAVGSCLESTDERCSLYWLGLQGAFGDGHPVSGATNLRQTHIIEVGLISRRIPGDIVTNGYPIICSFPCLNRGCTETAGFLEEWMVGIQMTCDRDLGVWLLRQVWDGGDSNDLSALIAMGSF